MRITWLIPFIGLIPISCNSDDDHPETKELILHTSINETRVSKLTFSKGDEIGVFLVDYINGSPGELGGISNAESMNIRYTYTGDNWFPPSGEEPLLGETISDLYTYYPYDEEMSRIPEKANLTAYPFTIASNQTNYSQEDDFLWSKITGLSATNNQAIIVYRHLMGRFEVNLQFEDPISTTSGADLYIYNTKTECTINLRVGEVTAHGSSSIIKPEISSSITSGYDITYNAILVPQLIPVGTPLFTVETENGTLLYETDREINIESQKLYIFNMVVKSVEASANNIQIENNKLFTKSFAIKRME